MDISSLFPSTDNLFKFLFLGGMIMVFTAMIYPLQKMQEREIEILSHNQQVELINKEVISLTQDIAELKKKVKVGITTLEGLEKSKTRTKNKDIQRNISNQISSIQKELNSANESLKKRQGEIEIKVVVIKYNEEKIFLLKKYVDTYDAYSTYLLVFGIPLSALGLFFWSWSTFKTEKLISKELKKP